MEMKNNENAILVSAVFHNIAKLLNESEDIPEAENDEDEDDDGANGVQPPALEGASEDNRIEDESNEDEEESADDIVVEETRKEQIERLLKGERHRSWIVGTYFSSSS